jgi:MFS family permease
VISPAAASTATATPSSGAPTRRLGLALAVIATAQLTVVLDGTIVNVARPHIQNALGFSGTNLEWVVNAYTLVFGGLLLLGGRSGDLLVFAARRATPRPLILSVYGSAAVTAAFVALLGWLLAETRDGSVLGLAERLTTSIQTCWPFIVAVALRRTRRPAAGPQNHQDQGTAAHLAGR